VLRGGWIMRDAFKPYSRNLPELLST